MSQKHYLFAASSYLEQALRWLRHAADSPPDTGPTEQDFIRKDIDYAQLRIKDTIDTITSCITAIEEWGPENKELPGEPATTATETTSAGTAGTTATEGGAATAG